MKHAVATDSLYILQVKSLTSSLSKNMVLMQQLWRKKRKKKLLAYFVLSGLVIPSGPTIIKIEPLRVLEGAPDKNAPRMTGVMMLVCGSKCALEVGVGAKILLIMKPILKCYFKVIQSNIQPANFNFAEMSCKWVVSGLHLLPVHFLAIQSELLKSNGWANLQFHSWIKSICIRAKLNHIKLKKIWCWIMHKSSWQDKDFCSVWLVLTV